MRRQWRLCKRTAAVARTHAPGRSAALTMALLAACGDEPVVAPPAAVVSAAESSASVWATPTGDRDILIMLYNATDGPNWVNNENWLTDAPMGEWYGVDTDASGRVVRLDLSGQLDQQTREWTTHGLAGAIPPELGGLASLETLSLARNELTGAIPPELGGLANLKTLSLGRNELTGAIPPELGGLVNLETLALRWNALTGAIPPELGGLAGLDTLSLTVNELTGAIPPELGGLANLRTLSLGWNGLTGAIPPELGGLANLEALSLSENDLTGVIPPELGSLANLETLWLGLNDLTGVIPPELGGLANLETLSLGPNSLTGAIPPELGRLANLKNLLLGSSGVTGAIPPELGGLASLENLSLGSNGLTGSIPPELGGLPSLERLWLGSNDLTGSVPSSFLQLDELKEFWFPGNAGLCAPGTTGFVEWLSRVERYQGPLCNAADEAALVSLHEAAGGANWTNPEGWLGGGALEEWHGVTVDSLGRVTVLDLTGNGLSGRLPWTMGELARMTELRIAGNPDLAGRLPLSLTRLSLRTLHYSGTDLCAPAEEVFREWLGGIQSHQGTGEECALLPDRAALEALYETTGGPNWIESDNWLTLAPLAVWDGVRTDADGRVTGLDLRGNGLEGPIPPELGMLAGARVVVLAENELSGPIPAELGGLASVEELDLEGNQLTSVPPELGELANLQALTLNFNRLTTVPPELGRLSRLDYLGLWSNELTSIPAELGDLGNLRELDLDENRLTSIPAELAGLERLEILWAASNELASIPPELGAMNSLRLLVLEGNRLTGFGMAPGGYPELRTLDLSSNELTSFPSEPGALGKLRQLELDGNRLTDIPPGLGGLAALEVLDVASNELSGALPAELVELTGLRSLGLADNVGLTGALPLDLTALESLEDLHTTGTELCAPADPAFLDWLEGVTRQRVALCDRSGGAAAYLTQAVQSREFPVPLVAGKPALLRVFVTAEQATDATMPAVRATFYRDGAVTYELDIPAKQDPIPVSVDESSLAKSVNAEIPGRVIQPGLEVVIEPDPQGTLDPALGVARRIPATGRMAVNVHAMPVFEVTLVPFIWDASPDSSIVDITAAMAADPEGHELFERTHLLLPVAGLDVTAHPPVASPTNNGFEILRLTEMIRVAEGGRGHYLGLMAGPTGPPGLLGVANDIGNWSSFSVLDSETIAHEFGHNRNLYHAPCGGAGGPDRHYPYASGNIGAWGYDFRTGELVQPQQPDFMSYCEPTWTSDYQFTNALRYRLETETNSIVIMAADTRAATSSRTLLIWGGLDGEGAPYLKPAFFIDAPPALPSSDGAWSLTGRDAGGGELFSVSLGMAEFTDTEEDHAGFTLALPVTWTGQLASITLEGPGGSANLEHDTDAPVTILRDAATGRIRAVLDGPPAEAVAAGPGAAAARQGFEVLFSRGIPDAENDPR